MSTVQQRDRADRLDALNANSRRETPREDVFDPLAQLAAHVCGCPMAAVGFSDSKHQRFQAVVGIPFDQTERVFSFCVQTIANRSDLVVVEDTTEHPFYASHSVVTGPPQVRFFAAAPLVTSQGERLGAIAVFDTQPRTLSDDQRRSLQMLADQAMALLELRSQRQLLAQSVQEHKQAHHGAPVQSETPHTAHVGGWTIELPQERLNWSQETVSAYRLHHNPGHVNDLLSLYSPPYREAMTQALQACIRNGTPLDMEGELVLSWGQSLWVRTIGRTVRDAQGGIVRIEGTLQDLSRQRQAQQASQLNAARDAALEDSPDAENHAALLHLQLRHVTDRLHASEQQYRMLFNEHPHPMWVYDKETLELQAVNHSMVLHYGYSEAELLGMRMTDLWPEERREAIKAAIDATNMNRRSRPVISRHITKTGEFVDMEITAGSISFNGRPARQVLATDVTERLRTERELARMSRAHRLLSACNEALVRATSEAALLQAICQIAVDIGGYRMGWVGFALDDEQKRIEPVAHAGYNPDYLEKLCLSWSEDHPHGRGPAGMAIRSGKPVIMQDIRREDQFGEWTERMLQHGFHGVICLPLRGRDRTFGLFYLYAPEILHISAEEATLLQQLSNDVAFGITNLRAHQAQQRLQGSVLKVAAAVSASTGTEFFVQLARNMADAVGAQAGCVVRLYPQVEGQPLRATTLAAVMDGVMLPTADDDLTGAPCLRLLTQRECVVTERAQQLYPDAPMLRRVGAQSYAGQQLCNADGEVVGMVSVLFRQAMTETDFITSTLQIFAARASAEIDRQLSDARIRHQASLLDEAQDAIMVRDLDHRIIFWNKSAERLYGWSQLQVLGQSVETLLYEDTTQFQHAAQAVLEHGEWTGEIVQRHRDGTIFEVEGRWTLVHSDDGQPQSILAIHTDIRQRKASEREIQRLAFFDALTGLPNRMLLMDRMHQALATAQRRQQGGALLFIDLDNFKTLNDTLGHDQGDLLLQQVAQRLNTCVRSVDTVARLGGDEFVVMLEELSARPQELAKQARGVAEKILAMLDLPYPLQSYQYRSTPSIGVAPFTGNETSVGELLKQADLAMYQAKTAGRNTMRFFDPEMQAVVTARAGMENDLRAALAQEQLVLHYQPQMHHTGRCVGVEALVRWAHPERGLIAPGDFISLAEETGLILPLGRWVLHTACKLLAAWQADPTLSKLTMAVNVSSRQFRHASFVDDVVRVLAVTGAPACRLKLELTESVLVDDMEVTIATMTALRSHGVCFALDDFGTGYSSLSYLKRMPLDQLKIDQSFVRDLRTDANDAVIVDTIVGLSRSMGLQVIAEGVEAHDQRDLLIEAGCMHFQGYLCGRPLAVDELEAFVRPLVDLA